MKVIDLNADLGESDNSEGLAREAAMMAFLSSASIACGGHAGDRASMTDMIKAALETDTVIGAHPAYPDRENFGRKSLKLGQDIEPNDLQSSLLSQIVTLMEIAAEHGAELKYVKPHGALYNDSVNHPALADLIATTIHQLDPNLIMVGAPGSAMRTAAEKAGLRFVAEGFLDRRYTDDGHLQNRRIDGAVLKTVDERLAQLDQILSFGSVTTAAGNTLKIDIQTLCLHGDSSGALETARQVRASVLAHDIQIRSFVHA